MPSNYKVTMFMGTERWGWTETYYFRLADSIWGSVLARAVLLCNRRIALLSKDCKMEAVRVSDIAVNGASQVAYADKFDSNAYSQYTMESPWAAMLGNLVSIFGDYKRPILLRGLPETWVQWAKANPVTPTWPATMETPWNNFVAELVGDITDANGWCIRARPKGGDAPVHVDIMSAAISTVSPLGYYQVTPAIEDVFLLGNKVHVWNAKGKNATGLTGDATVLRVLPEGELILSRRPTCPVDSVTVQLSTVPTMSHIEHTLQRIGSANRERIVKRDTGRAFFGTRGRQSVQTC